MATANELRPQQNKMVERRQITPYLSRSSAFSRGDSSAQLLGSSGCDPPHLPASVAPSYPRGLLSRPDPVSQPSPHISSLSLGPAGLLVLFLPRTPADTAALLTKTTCHQGHSCCRDVKKSLRAKIFCCCCCLGLDLGVGLGLAPTKLTVLTLFPLGGREDPPSGELAHWFSQEKH